MLRSVLTIALGLLAGCHSNQTTSTPTRVSGAERSARTERVVQAFDSDWLFHKGGLDAVPTGDDAAGWVPVRLPHDWAIEGPFDREQSGEQAKLPWRTEGWYQRWFTVDPASVEAGRRTLFVFDGVMSNASVFVNGRLAGSWRYGYNSFVVDATEFVRTGENHIAVHADNTAHYSRWYPGAGIYRRVQRVSLAPIAVPIWGVAIETPLVSDDAALVRVRTEIESVLDEPGAVVIESEIRGEDGALVASGARSGVRIPARGSVTLTHDLEIAAPRRWDIDDPHLYTLRTRVLKGGRIIDERDDAFGVRTFAWTADDGFHLNGRRVQIRGVNLHHDNGPLGAAAFRDAIERKLRIMKDMGANSIRTSHNPPSPHLLDLCDEMGLLVIDELFDKWGATASVDVGTERFVREYAEAEVRNLIRRDRNHPCVVLWSIGNEIGDVLRDADGRGAEHIAAVEGMFKKHDPTRPTSMGLHVNSAADGDLLRSLDTQGWNYGAKYRRARRSHPDVPMIYSESASAFSTRGAYRFPHPEGPKDYGSDFVESSYDRTAASWSDIPEIEFDRVERDGYVAGEYVWTGFDYLGEPTPHTRDARSSYFGIVDLVGIPKDRFFLYRSEWNDAQDTVHLLPHWTWPGREGVVTPVYVYTSGDSAELFLNGESLGRREKRSAKGAASGNLASGAIVYASSEQLLQKGRGNVIAENRADKAVDGSVDTRWAAESADFPQSLTIDLGERTPIGSVSIDWESAATNYRYTVEAGDELDALRVIGDETSSSTRGRRSVTAAEAEARFVRLVVKAAEGKWWASVRELRVLGRDAPAESVESPYYDLLDHYRLRWEGVRYLPGTLRAVAYREGEMIGQAEIETAGEATSIRLTPERLVIPASGDALAYILVEAVDDQGRLCPNDHSPIDFEVEGPATIAGIGNGNPMGYDPFHDASHPLFSGKAMLILRGSDGDTGTIRVAARSEGKRTGRAQLFAEH